LTTTQSGVLPAASSAAFRWNAKFVRGDVLVGRHGRDLRIHHLNI
jgi:hypothetical protein